MIKMSFSFNTKLFVIIAIYTIHSASSQHSALYVIETFDEDEYVLPYDAEYDDKDERLTLKVSEKHLIHASCPRKNNPKILEIVNNAEKKMPVNITCQDPVKSQIYTYINRGAIGFEVHVPGKKFSTEYSDVPEDHKVMELINFVFDEESGLVEWIWYHTPMGFLLSPEITHAVSQSTDTFVKVQLAPEEDFFFDTWKLATRNDILTFQMRRNLLHQWRALEKFVRKIIKVLEEIHITTGVNGTQIQSDATNESLLPTNSEKKEYHVSKYFWKAILYTFEHGDQKFRHGILIVMHNSDPSASLYEQKICTEDETQVAEAGWEFHHLDDGQPIQGFMYACLYNKKNVEFLGAVEEAEYKILNLHNTPVEFCDEKGHNQYHHHEWYVSMEVE